MKMRRSNMKKKATIDMIWDYINKKETERKRKERILRKETKSLENKISSLKKKLELYMTKYSKMWESFNNSQDKFEESIIAFVKKNKKKILEEETGFKIGDVFEKHIYDDTTYKFGICDVDIHYSLAYGLSIKILKVDIRKDGKKVPKNWRNLNTWSIDFCDLNKWISSGTTVKIN
jgi:hypothetical protein